MRNFILFILCLSIACLPVASAQLHTFDSGNQNWGASGDPVSTSAVWYANGGNPGGYIRVTDASIGGTWYFEAPATFRGNHCDAYGKMLSYDQFTSDTLNQQISGGNPDVVLEGGGLILVYDQALNPTLAWRHYTVVLQENAGWRLNSATGQIPTQAQFKTVLSNITALRIRGEYRSQADYGGLDNVELQRTFRFDLDGDNSSGETSDGFRSDTLCKPVGNIVDADAVLTSEDPIDSLRIRIIGATASEELKLDILVGGIQVQFVSPGWILLVNEGSATAADFLLLLQQLVYQDNGSPAFRGERLLEFRIYTGCGDLGGRFAYLPVFPKPFAGADADTTLCLNSAPLNLNTLLGAHDPGGAWTPALQNNLLDPAKNNPGRYEYRIPGAGTCPGDTAAVVVSITPAFSLRPDTTLCYGDTLRLNRPGGLDAWTWSDGSRNTQLAVTQPAVVSLVGNKGLCQYQDSTLISFYTCETCTWYAPNIFSPNDDGENDAFEWSFPCVWNYFTLRIYDRWGNLVYQTDTPDQPWDGYVKGRKAEPGVYVWQVEWEGELYGEPRRFRKTGNVTVWR